MLFRLEIETDNSAFGDTPAERAAEVARILLAASSRLRAGALSVKLRDANGNHVGVAYFEEVA